MRRLLLAWLATVAIISSASADFTGKDASLATITFKNASGACTAVVCVPQAAITDNTGTTFVAVNTAGADAVSNTANGLLTYGRNLVFNGTTWDRWQGAVTITGTPPLPTGAATSALQTTANTTLSTIAANTALALPSQSNTVPVGGIGICDGANSTTNPCTTAATVKAASTAPSATDKALVVAVSPNGLDPCSSATGPKPNLAIATSTGTTQLVAPSGSTQVYVCSFSLIAAATATVNLVGGTGATCTTGTPVAAIGSTTAANGLSLAANGGLTFGNGGATVTRTTTGGHGLCLIQSGTTALAGNITYVQQ